MQPAWVQPGRDPEDDAKSGAVFGLREPWRVEGAPGGSQSGARAWWQVLPQQTLSSVGGLRKPGGSGLHGCNDREAQKAKIVDAHLGLGVER